MTTWATLEIECLCGAANRQIRTRRQKETEVSLSICHCDTCRYSSGILCMSYFPCQKPLSVAGLRKYEGSDSHDRFFCVRCGCHMFRRCKDTGWEVATGTIKGKVGDDGADVCGTWAEHLRIFDTKDGGLSRWLLEIEGVEPECDYSLPPPSSLVQPPAAEPPKGAPSDDSDEEEAQKETLLASCDCGTVKFQITRPDEESLLPSAAFPDLMIPYCDDKQHIAKNDGDAKWWVVDNKYRAGTCACRSCRLSSGFEIQTWAFIPRANILLTLDDETTEPLDFDTIPHGVLHGYSSSEGVTRNFCGTCGATVFWHRDDRPELIDVSVGLLRATEGARAPSWLCWWKKRVSFAEEVGLERWGDVEERARGLVESLLLNMKSDYADDLKYLEPDHPF